MPDIIIVTVTHNELFIHSPSHYLSKEEKQKRKENEFEREKKTTKQRNRRAKGHRLHWH